MAIKSYDESYLPYVAENVGTMFEYAVACGCHPIQFWRTFVVSKVAVEIEKGNPRYLVGYSAIDYVNIIINTTRSQGKIFNAKSMYNRDRYYWAGWILAQYQYISGYSYLASDKALPIIKVLDMYDVLHEADINKFFDIADSYLKQCHDITNLKRIRLARGLSQADLARIADVDIRSIQSYEQGANNINKARADKLYRISKALGCCMEDLME